MVGIKGNNGKSQSPIKQLLIAAVIAIAVIGTIKLFGTGSWHNKSVMDDHGQERQRSLQVHVGADKDECRRPQKNRKVLNQVSQTCLPLPLSRWC